MTLPKEVRDRLSIEPNDELSAILVRSVLEIAPEPGSNLATATAGREDWTNMTPTDVGKTLFGPMGR